MTKVVINACFGGFGLSHAAVMRYAELAGIKLLAFVNDRSSGASIMGCPLVPYDGSEEAFYISYSTAPLVDGKIPDGAFFSEYRMERTDPHLIQVVTEMGETANGQCSSLRTVDVPDDAEWEIEEYDGFEHVAEVHRTWP